MAWIILGALFILAIYLIAWLAREFVRHNESMRTLPARTETKPALNDDSSALLDSDESESIRRSHSSALLESQTILTELIDRCIDAHPSAVKCLATIAASDGRLSRTELQIIVWFCERHGMEMSLSWREHLNHLNAGITVTVSGPTNQPPLLDDLQYKPIGYLCDLYAAITAIATPWRRANGSKWHSLLAKLEFMIERRRDPVPV